MISGWQISVRDVLLPSVSVVVFLLLGELWVRLPIAAPMSSSKVDMSSVPLEKQGVFMEGGKQVHYTWGYRVQNNTFGFRDREVKSPKPENTFRVIVVGDSASWGTGLPLEKRYTNLAEKRVNEILQDRGINLGVEVLTFAKGGGYLGKYLSYVKAYHDRVEPDLICVALTFNDMNRKGTADEGTRQKFQDVIIPKWTHGLKKVNYFSSMFLQRVLSQKAIFNLLEECGVVPDVYEAVWISGYDKKKKNWKRFISNLQEMFDLSVKVSGKTPMIMYLMIPVSSKRVADYSTPGKHEAMEQKMFGRIKPVVKAMGYYEVDLFPSFKTELDGKFLGINTNDSHPNELCQKIYARELAKAILEHGSLSGSNMSSKE